MVRPLVIVSALAGVALLVIAFVYFVEPASTLPSFFPGYEPGVAAHHTKHAIGSALLGLAAFALAWFQSKPRKTA